MAEKVFRGLLRWFPDFRKLIEVELGQTEQRWAHEAPGHDTPPGASRGGSWPPPLSSGPLSKLLVSLMSRKKISKKFRGIWTSFGTDILENQKRQKTTTSTGH